MLLRVYHCRGHAWAYLSAIFFFFFRCQGPKKHNVVAHLCRPDSRAKQFFQYILFHELGISHALLKDVISQKLTGESFKAIEERIQRRYAHGIKSAEIKHQLLRQNSIEPWTPTPNYVHNLKNAHPSDDTISAFYVHYVEHHMDFYRSSMASILPQTLRIDHTFKASVNVGYKSQVSCSNNKWVQQYYSLFFVLCGDGYVVAWQFCPNQKHKTVYKLLQNIKQRQGCHVKDIYTDKCCSDRNILEDIFGPNVNVYLDTFHFKQRLVKALPRHVNKWAASRHLKVLFQGEKHWSREEMMSFLKAWEDSCMELGVRTSILAKAINAARKHILKGCLDKNGAGTQPNENLHKHINKVIQPCRKGVSLATAEFTLFAHNWNMKKFQSMAKAPNKETNLDPLLLHDLFAHEFDGIIPQTHEHFGPPKDDDASPKNYDEDTMLNIWCKLRDVDPYVQEFLDDIFVSHPNADVHGVGDIVYRIPVPADGYCFYHALAYQLKTIAAIDVTWQEVFARVVAEFSDNPNSYNGIIGEPHRFPEMVRQFQQAGPQGWTTILGDAVPLAAARAFGVVLVVHEIRPNGDDNVHVIVPRDGQAIIDMPIHLNLENSHYEPIEADQELGQSTPATPRMHGPRTRSMAFAQHGLFLTET